MQTTRSLARDGPSRTLATLALLALAPAPAASGQAYYQPTGPEFRVNLNSNYSQFWVRVAMNEDASRVGFSFNSGNDMFARFFDADGPLTGDLPCNTSFKNGTQDEGEIGWSVDGRYLVAFNDRAGADGEQMGIFGRIYTSAGVPIAPNEFQINEAWQASQWRPLIATHPNGGWVVAFTGDWDADPLFRIVNSDGTFATGDVNVDTFGPGPQADTAPAVAPDGTILMVFVDYSGQTQWNEGTDLWFRLFDAAGQPLMAQEQIVAPKVDQLGDQREPRAAADGLGRFIVVWEDDGDPCGTCSKDWNIFGRRIGSTGALIGSVFQVNTSTAGNHRSPRVAADAAGNFTVTWVSQASPSHEILAQRYDTNGLPIGGEFVVNAGLGGNQARPSLDMDDLGENTVFCWEGPFVQTDSFGRRFTTYQAPTPYCTAGSSASGCQALLDAVGIPSATAASGFDLTASGVEGSKDGIFFFGANGRQANPWGSGTSYQCVVPPVMRTPLITGTGTAGACDGTFSQDLNALWCPSCPQPAKNPGVGTMVQAQLWYRDPLSTSNQTTSLSNGLEFTIRP
jgi:hypothetical protein